jgi:hypothetical protein
MTGNGSPRCEPSTSDPREHGTHNLGFPAHGQCAPPGAGPRQPRKPENGHKQTRFQNLTAPAARHRHRRLRQRRPHRRHHWPNPARPNRRLQGRRTDPPSTPKAGLTPCSTAGRWSGHRSWAQRHARRLASGSGRSGRASGGHRPAPHRHRLAPYAALRRRWISRKGGYADRKSSPPRYAGPGQRDVHAAAVSRATNPPRSTTRRRPRRRCRLRMPWSRAGSSANPTLKANSTPRSELPSVGQDDSGPARPIA